MEFAQTMAANPLHHKTIRARQGRKIRIFAFFGLLGVLTHGAWAQQDPADRLPPELRELLLPTVTTLEGEDRVVTSSLIEALPGGGRFGSIARGVWSAGGGVVLEDDRPGLVLHYYAEGIKAMTLVDKVWEGLPRRAESLQALIDEVITRARTERRPIGQLIIAGHAGLPGCSALGGQMEDCTFRGRLTTYQRKQLTRLRPYLAKDAQIELRQCGTGSGKEGQRLLTAIYETTGATTSSYLADFHFGDAANHPRVQVGPRGFEIVEPDK